MLDVSWWIYFYDGGLLTKNRPVDYPGPQWGYTSSNQGISMGQDDVSMAQVAGCPNPCIWKLLLSLLPTIRAKMGSLSHPKLLPAGYGSEYPNLSQIHWFFTQFFWFIIILPKMMWQVS